MKWFQIKRGLALAVLLAVLSGCGEPEAMEPPPQEPVSAEPSSGESEPPEAVSAGRESEPPRQTAAPDETGGPDESEGAEDAEPPEPSAPAVAGLMGKGESVEDDWFADAVFVGDSRTDGLKLYSGIKSPTFISHQGLSVFNIGSKECIETGSGKVTALAALGGQQWAKVYLMLGVNELGYGSESFREAYTELVRKIEELQPDATIYIQTILPVNEEIARKKGISSAINNERVVLFNGIIAEVADSEGTALVDVAANFWSEAGEMAAENTSDGVHLTRQGYVSWYEYLKSHTGTTEPLEEPGTHIYVPGSAPSEEPAAEPGDPEGPADAGADGDGPPPEESDGEGQSAPEGE